MGKKLPDNLTVFSKELQGLVDELTKDEPNKAKIKKLMTACGLPYSTNPIHQLSTVLNSVSTSVPTSPKTYTDKDVEI